MKQLAQSMRGGSMRLVEVPSPQVRPGGVLVRNQYSVISPGTERMKLELAEKTLLGKARERPEEVRKVLEAVRREGIAATAGKVRDRLEALSPFGYSCAGIVEAVGEGVSGFRVGQRVACAGAGQANHAERVFVPQNLAVPVPDAIPLDHAAFATLGAIAMQGVRQADVSLGDVVVVIGLGIIGQLTLQLLRASGCAVIGVDLDEGRVRLARDLVGSAVLRSDDVVGEVTQTSQGRGADAILITASTSSDDPMRLAARLARDRARVVVVGAVPLSAPREPFYLKELEVRLSRSYGPGRYDPRYEEKGQDYPVGYVRWTERRNMAEFLRLLGSGSVTLEPLITRRYAFSDAERAYEELGRGGSAALGVVLEYPKEPPSEPARITVERAPRARRSTSGSGVGLVGAGSFASVLVPAIKSAGGRLTGVVTAGGLSARSAAERHGFAYLAASPEELLLDRDTSVVVIATRHADHARLAAAALRVGKAVYVEKPLALTEEDLDDVVAAAMESGRPLMVGFNRRFAPATRLISGGLSGVAGAKVIHIRVNAGAAPAQAWVHDRDVGGGRLVGEGCHFIDLAMHFAGSRPVDVYVAAVGSPDADADLEDNVQVTLRFQDGSLAGIVYTSKGDVRAGKERVEVFAGGHVGVLDDFRRAEWSGSGRRRWRGRPDKGHAAAVAAFLGAVRAGDPSPIPVEELEAATRATLRAARSLRSGRREPV